MDKEMNEAEIMHAPFCNSAQLVWPYKCEYIALYIHANIRSLSLKHRSTIV